MAYSYRVVAQGGTPEQLVALAEASVEVTTETVDHGNGHAVWFNRAAVASQAYVREFEQQTTGRGPRTGRRTSGLSRGLEEALYSRSSRAVADSTWRIRGSIYEFQYSAALDALLRRTTRAPTSRSCSTTRQ